MKSKLSKKDQIFKQTVDFIKKNKVLPTRSDMLKLGVSRDMIRYYFGNLQLLHELAIRHAPKIVKKVKPLQNKEVAVIYKLAGVKNVK